jgi:hypothetical protein
MNTLEPFGHNIGEDLTRISAFLADERRELIAFGVRVTRRHIDEICAILPRSSCRR